MPLDACMISALAEEFKRELVGAKIEKIHQPEKDKVELHLRAKGRPVRLALYACPGSPRVFLTEQPKENPPVPPLFCTVLRKHLGSGILTGVRQPNFERMLSFDFKTHDEMGFESACTLTVELMGKYANLLLCDEKGKILCVMRPIDFSGGEERQLLVGMTYELPPAQEGKVDPLTETKEAFFKKAENAGDRAADRFLLSSYRGFSPLVCREIAFTASGMTDCATDAYKEELWAEFEKMTAIVKNADFMPVLMRFEDEKNNDYTFFAPRQYGKAAELLPFSSPSALLDGFYAEKARTERIKYRAIDLYKLLSAADARLARKIEMQKKELLDCADKEKYKNYGELITANLYALKKGDRSAQLVDYYDPEMPKITLVLDERLTPVQNAQKYFKKYTKAKSAEVALTKQIARAEEERAYLSSVKDALDRAVLPSETEEIRAELASSGYLKNQKKRAALLKKQSGDFLTYKTSDGFTLLVGKNNLQNDRLSFKVASKNDWWFHVHAAPGSHVVLLCEGVDDPPASTFTEASAVAAANSSLSGSARVTVDYTRVKNLKKPPSAHPGYVIYHTNFSTEVDPSIEKTVKKL